MPAALLHSAPDYRLAHMSEHMCRGQQRRHVASTQMNRESSRSHLIISVCIEATNLQTQNVTRGKLSFVDLAGFERCACTALPDCWHIITCPSQCCIKAPGRSLTLSNDAMSTCTR